MVSTPAAQLVDPESVKPALHVKSQDAVSARVEAQVPMTPFAGASTLQSPPVGLQVAVDATPALQVVDPESS
jgi:hypothetical protein